MTIANAMGGVSGDFSIPWTGAIPIKLALDFDTDSEIPWSDRYFGALQKALGRSVILVGVDELRETLNVPLTEAELVSFRERLLVAMEAVEANFRAEPSTT